MKYKYNSGNLYGNKILRDILPDVNVNFTPERQLEKVLEEHAETVIEVEAGNKLKILEEGIDMLVAGANVLYRAGFNDTEINAGLHYVYAKLNSRGKLR